LIESRVAFTVTDSKVIERLIEDDNVGINHMVLTTGDALPIHNANSNVYMIVARGAVSLELDDQEKNTYEHGSILLIPYKTKMHVFNEGTDPVELFVVKAPSPRHMKE